MHFQTENARKVSSSCNINLIHQYQIDKNSRRLFEQSFQRQKNMTQKVNQELGQLFQPNIHFERRAKTPLNQKTGNGIQGTQTQVKTETAQDRRTSEMTKRRDKKPDETIPRGTWSKQFGTTSSIAQTAKKGPRVNTIEVRSKDLWKLTGFERMIGGIEAEDWN